MRTLIICAPLTKYQDDKVKEVRGTEHIAFKGFVENAYNN
jgi:hypothetical protein